LRNPHPAFREGLSKILGAEPNLTMIVAGRSNSDIAVRFAIGESTVKQYLRSIFDKLGVHNRLELALFALHHNLALSDVDG